ncbi:hypothetical protein Hypma_016210 [Hypsizygus marmoreus]|uniref:DUF6532 domain-containing protein n=1 Tax=Hypsizygus marmoreus TaxID=39966 RepID=A0A369J5D2_HYPMA|nr:hypothetical protein Hypma_016210 [Hypsizygus marmoreus]
MTVQSKPIQDSTRKTCQSAAHSANKENQGRQNTTNASKTTVAREARERRPTEKIVSRQQAEEEKARLQEEMAERRVAKAKKAQRKADKEAHRAAAAAGDSEPEGDDDYEGDEPLPDTVFHSRTVTSKPVAKKVLAQCQGRIPATVIRSRPLATEPFIGRSQVDDDDDFSTVPALLDVRDGDDDEDSGGDNGPRKRARSADSEHNVPIKAQKIHESTGRLKALDYNELAKEVLSVATSIFRCLISTRGAFPSHLEEIGYIKDAWLQAHQTLGLPQMLLTPDLAAIIKSRGSQVRGEVKTKFRPIIENLRFESGCGKRVIAKNRQLAEKLKDSHSFVYKTLPDDMTSPTYHLDRKGLYQNPIIQKAVNTMWFANKNDEGIKYSDLFKPLPVQTIALVLMVIECCIDEWLTGTRTDLAFYANDYSYVYETHIACLEEFGTFTVKLDLLGNLQNKLYNFGRIHSGAGVTGLQDIRPLDTRAFQAAMDEYEADSATDEDGWMLDG